MSPLTAAESRLLYRITNTGPAESRTRITEPSGTIWPVAVANLQQLQALDVLAELALGLHVHLPDAAELVELVDVDRAHVGVERREDVAQRDAHLLHRVAVDVEIQLRASAKSWHRRAAEADWALARWRADRGDPAAALDALAAMRERLPGAHAAQSRLVEADCLIRLGRTAEARALLDPHVATDPEAALLRAAAEDAASPEGAAARLALVAAAFGLPGLAPADPALPPSLDNLAAAAPAGPDLLSVIVPVHGAHWELAPGLLADLAAQTPAGRPLRGPPRQQRRAGAPAPAGPAAGRRLRAARLLDCPAPGSYAARNFGAARARGALLVFTDADCAPEPGWLAALAAAAAAQPGRLLAGPVRMTGAATPAGRPAQPLRRLRPAARHPAGALRPARLRRDRQPRGPRRGLRRPGRLRRDPLLRRRRRLLPRRRPGRRRHRARPRRDGRPPGPRRLGGAQAQGPPGQGRPDPRRIARIARALARPQPDPAPARHRALPARRRALARAPRRDRRAPPALGGRARRDRPPARRRRAGAPVSRLRRAPPKRILRR